MCASLLIQEYRAEVRRTFEATEKIFAADMKWRDDWVEGRKQERRNERRKARKALKKGSQHEEEEAVGRQERSANTSGGRIVPVEEGESGSGGDGSAGLRTGGNRCSGPAVRNDSGERTPAAEGDSSSGVMIQVECSLLASESGGEQQCHNAKTEEGGRGAGGYGGA